MKEGDIGFISFAWSKSKAAPTGQTLFVVACSRPDFAAVYYMRTKLIGGFVKKSKRCMFLLYYGGRKADMMRVVCCSCSGEYEFAFVPLVLELLAYFSIHTAKNIVMIMSRPDIRPHVPAATIPGCLSTAVVVVLHRPRPLQTPSTYPRKINSIRFCVST